MPLITLATFEQDRLCVREKRVAARTFSHSRFFCCDLKRSSFA
jgi:hypothetical protein